MRQLGLGLHAPGGPPARPARARRTRARPPCPHQTPPPAAARRALPVSCGRQRARRGRAGAPRAGRGRHKAARACSVALPGACFTLRYTCSPATPAAPGLMLQAGRSSEPLSSLASEDGALRRQPRLHARVSEPGLSARRPPRGRRARLHVVDGAARRVQVAQRVVEVARLAVRLALGAHAAGDVHEVVAALPAHARARARGAGCSGRCMWARSRLPQTCVARAWQTRV